MSDIDPNETRAGLDEAKAFGAIGISAQGLAIATAVLRGAIEPADVPGTDVLGRCIVLDGLREVVEKMQLHVDGGLPQQGTVAEYVDALFDRDDNRVGTITGTAVLLADPPMTHLWQLHRNVAEFDDGTIEAVGILGPSLAQGATGVLSVTGLSGRYAGRHGHRTLALIDGDGDTPHYAVTYVLC
ncbi:allene oxide cyclase barrel-like domain-containing protein [Dactylosporangium sp. CA-233914]|uniref:allene oxide cyclase barrel-like domain-containing protein n=1 Tax=Dactylosporangium sp. CA-233914 TaxID=3239934 RepID=UPI003D8FAC2B